LIRYALAALLAPLLIAPAQAQSLEQMAGQMIVVGFAGDSVNDAGVKALRDEIAAGTLGGVMYLRDNVASLKAAKAMNAAFRAASPDLPPFLTLDQEGGAVERLTAKVGFKEIASAEKIAASHSPERAGKTYGDMADAIAALGFTVNFGPVVDVNLNPANPVIGKFGRSFGDSADVVIPYAEAFVKAHHDAGLLTALKHFPGHGSSADDSHEGFVDISRTWKDEELEPYRALITDGLADLIMIGHLYHRDHSGGDTRLPASLSPDWITTVLRGELGYDGVVISDDLEMGAIRKHFDLKETVIRAVNAGTDVLLFSNTLKPHLGLADEIREILVAEAERDPAFRARIEESYRRIVALKGRIGAAPAGIEAAGEEPEAPIPSARPAGL
jgi:beta-N-acetylhexosaminidase